MDGGDWNTYYGNEAGRPTSITLDLQYQQSGAIAFPTLVVLQLKLANPRQDGMPQGDEFNVVYGIEDRLLNLLSNSNNSRFVGHKFSAGMVKYFFYTSNSSAVAAAAAVISVEFPGRQLDQSIVQDVGWSVYREMLLPKGDDIQQMADNNVIQTLSVQGDDIHKPRIIDHYAYFSTTKDRENFKKAILGEGFQIVKESLNTASKAQWSIVFHRLDAPVTITKATVELTHLAEQYSGDYDGWESPVISKP
ncbi:DUF695 domain-containing protein [Rhizobium leguminosarum]|uniref:DUF695 domain-containing protein n=1 Tax=Rhizobium leguminosarum TaxID=384 RepID=UPI003F955065